MRRGLLWCGVLVGLCVAPVGPALAQDDAATLNLRPDWEAGQQSRYEFDSTREETMTLMAEGERREMEQTVETSGEAVWRVEEVSSDGGATCTVDYDWLRVVMTGSEGQQQVNDTRDGSGDVPPLHDLLSAYAENPLTAVVAPDGTVEQVRGGDAVRRAVDNEAMAPSDRDLRENVTELAPITAAPAAAQVGDSWQADFTWSHEAGAMHYDLTYEIVGAETIADIPIATVAVDGRLSLEPEMPPQNPDAPDVDVALIDSDYESQIMFDLVRREAVGRYTSELQVIEQNISMQGRTATQQVERRSEARILRIGEQ